MLGNLDVVVGGMTTTVTNAATDRVLELAPVFGVFWLPNHSIWTFGFGRAAVVTKEVASSTTPTDLVCEARSRRRAPGGASSLSASFHEAT